MFTVEGTVFLCLASDSGACMKMRQGLEFRAVQGLG